MRIWYIPIIHTTIIQSRGSLTQQTAFATAPGHLNRLDESHWKYASHFAFSHFFRRKTLPTVS